MQMVRERFNRDRRVASTLRIWNAALAAFAWPGQRLARASLRAAMVLIALACGAGTFSASAQLWIWNESPVVRTIEPGQNFTLDLRNLGSGDDFAPTADFAFVTPPVSQRLAGFTNSRPSWISMSSGVLQVTNAQSGKRQPDLIRQGWRTVPGCSSSRGGRRFC